MGSIGTPTFGASAKKDLQSLRELFATGRTKSLDYRIAQLQLLRKRLLEYEKDICAAVEKDFHRAHQDIAVAEFVLCVKDIDDTINALPNWMKPEGRPTPVVMQPGSSEVVYSPKGVILCITPWNYPVNTTVRNCIAVIAAGSVPLLKPSEVSEHSCRVLVDKIFRDFPGVGIVEGAGPETQELLKLPFDHIIYTGNGHTAKSILKQAAENLTPCTLELGGKGPAILDRRENFGQSEHQFEVALKRILWSKHVNAGQTCVAVDYLICHEDDEEVVVAKIKELWPKFFEDAAFPNPSTCKDYGGCLISQKHFDRVYSYLAEDHGGRVVLGGIKEERNVDKRIHHIGFTVVVNPHEDAKLSTEEIFGPVLVVRTFGGATQAAYQQSAVDYVRARPHPLALYVFSADSAGFIPYIREHTISGGFVANDDMFQTTHFCLPFGGVGGSGFGRINGFDGFKELSHHRACLYRKLAFDQAERYPPYFKETMDFYKAVMVEGSLLRALVCKKRAKTRYT